MGKTALYRDPIPYRPARARVELEPDVLVVELPGGWAQRHVLDGVSATVSDGFVTAQLAAGLMQRRFVRMLALGRVTVITPPEQGAVAPNVVRVPEAPSDAAIVEAPTWEALAEWLLGGGRLAACSIGELARLACIATPQFAVIIGEVAAQRALELVWVAAGPLRGAVELDAVLQPLVDAARSSQRGAEALVSALAHTTGAMRRRRRG
ncbi:MAG TPA: hypothetical protein VH143_18795 [Kofleriaceae bacterium]|nr:hypothetical protein [Kofleriaceae bacterium]